MKQQRKASHWLASTLSGFGYISVLLQWLWISVLLLPSLLENEAINEFLLPDPSGQPTPHIELQGPPILFTIIAVMITIVILVVTVIVLVRLPVTVARSGQRIVSKTAEAALPVVTHHKKLPARTRRQLTQRLVMALKLLAAILPVALLGLLTIVPTTIPTDIAVLIECSLAIGTLLWFSGEYTALRFLRGKAA